MTRLAIVGSCVSRDLHTHVPAAEGALPVAGYVSRATMQSMASSPCPLLAPLLRSVKAKSFDERRFLQDIAKDHVQTIASAAPDVLLIDLIDERHGTAWLGDCAITHTRVCQAHLKAHRVRPDAIARPFDDRWRERQDAALRHNARRLRAAAQGARVLVHRARYATHFLEAGVRRPFEDQDKIARWNAYLTDAYDALQAEMGGTALAVDDNLVVAGGVHLWDVAPYHYDRGYYDALWRVIQRLLA